MKTVSTLSPPPRFWQPQWWIPDFDDDSRRSSIERIAAGASPTPTYYLLLVLSTLIAGYGLHSNSTATVIGAMIVAPLMGPILGLAMGIVVGDARLFHSSLLAELSGVVVVILTAFLVAQVTGVSQIDFMASEIAPLFSIWPLAWPPGWPEPFVLSIPRCRPVLPGLLSRWPWFLH